MEDKVIPVQFYSIEDIRDIEAAKQDGREPRRLQDLTFAKQGDACVDIRCCEDVTINPGEHVMIKTGLYTAIPEGWEIQIRPRSGISAKTPLIMKNTIGTIDAGYRGEIRVLWHNLSQIEFVQQMIKLELDKYVMTKKVQEEMPPFEEMPVTFKYGDRIAQMKVERVVPVEYIPVNTLEELQAIGVDRKGGFGSSGLS